MDRAPVALYSDVFIRPVELNFSRNSVGSLSALEILVVNKGKKSLRFKILSTTRTNYTLSKCKGILRLGEFTKIAVEPREPLPTDNVKDFFKIQFFDCADDSLQGERYLSACIWSSPPEPSFQSLDSDSCNSWTSQGESLLVKPTLRTVSLTRPLDTSPTEHLSVKGISSEHQRTLIPGQPIVGKYNPKDRLLSGNRGRASGALSVHSSTRKSADVCEDLTSCVRSLAFSCVFLLCILGICLPLVTNNPWELIDWIYSDRRRRRSAHSAILPDQICPVPLFAPEVDHESVSPISQLTEDDFSRHSRLAVHYLKASIESVLEAISSINPLNAVSNLSWFCLGLVIMFYLARR